MFSLIHDKGLFKQGNRLLPSLGKTEVNEKKYGKKTNDFM
jgi:hypothetical protein